MGSTETVQSTETVETKEPIGIGYGKIARVVMLAVPVIVIAVLAVLNTSKVPVDWVVGDAQTHLWIIIAVAAAVGFVGGYIACWRRS